MQQTLFLCLALVTVVYCRSGCYHKLTGYGGLVNTDAYPNKYKTNADCYWLIETEANLKIQLRFIDFQLKGDCNQNYLEIFDGESPDFPLIGKYCKHSIPEVPFETNGNKLFLKLTSVGNHSGRGFEASWISLQPYVETGGRIVKRDLHNGCGGEYIKNDGFITSPNYPGNYPASSNCQYLIKTDGFNEIVLTFQDFDLEPHKECRYDYVQVRNGGDLDSEIIGKYCGDNKPDVIKSTGTALLIEFVSDTNTQATGFKASWKMKRKVSAKVEGCGGSLNGETGTVTSPGYPRSYASDLVCTWNIEVPANARILFVFEDLDLLDDPNCVKGYVQLHNGRDHGGNSLGLYCGNILPRPILSAENSMSVGLLDDGNITTRGFKARWQVMYPTTTTVKTPVDPDTLCGRTFTSSSGYIVRSSGKTNCSYNVIVPDGQKISVEVLELNMADDPECKREQIEVRDGIHNSPFLARSCGNLKPEIVVSSSNQIQIRHTVFDEQKSSGFKLHWEVYKKRENTVIFDSADCGVSKIEGSSVLKGVAQGLGLLPWTAGIIGTFGIVRCGGVILSPNWILTAAHCFYRLPWKNMWRIRVGEFDLMKNEGKEQTFLIRRIYMHPEYNSSTYENDITLLHLKGEIEFNDYVNSICLPRTDSKVAPGSKCSVAGWGARKYLRQPTGSLTHVKPKVVSHEECNKESSYNGKVTNTMICAGGSGIDSCQGDGGGGLTCGSSEKQEVIGISSWGNGCAIPDKYGVYTDVRKYLDWIEKTVSS